MSFHPQAQLFESAQSERPLSRTEYCLLHHVGEVCAIASNDLLCQTLYWNQVRLGLFVDLERYYGQALQQAEWAGFHKFLEHLKWESLKKRRRDSRLILLYKGLKGNASIPTDDLIPLVRRCRNDHSMSYQVPIANTDIYKCSFFPQTIRDWNALSDSISSAEGAEDGVAKFTSQVRARD